MSELLAVEDQPLYAAHMKVYPREVDGRFARLRILTVIALLGLFYVTPWVRWDGRQAVLFDLPARKFYIFGLTFFPQDFFMLTWLLIIAALSLFFFTALAGRLWCGYACPQTVWTEIYVWMERWTEGKWARRMKLDKAPWSVEKFSRKAAKQALWVGFSALTGFTFVGFFAPIRELAAGAAAFQLSSWELFWVVFYGFATYGNAGYMREQVCKYMCPYARFQSAMFDRHTLVISYDAGRGEPRGARQRESAMRKQGAAVPAGTAVGGAVAAGAPAAKPLGDCIDCTMCVQACPTGIDIRNGLQYECIACAACIDACDVVMDKMGYARGLVRYSTQAEMDGAKRRLLRPRILLYACGLLLLIVGFAVAVTHRLPVNVDVLRDRNALYRTLDDGEVENVYSVRIINKDQHAHRFVVSALNLPNAVVDCDAPTQNVGAEEVKTAVVRVRVPAAQEHGGRSFNMLVRSVDEPRLTISTRTRFFAGP
jgi:cytochrome c oxidase accessory protein FixG